MDTNTAQPVSSYQPAPVADPPQDVQPMPDFQPGQPVQATPPVSDSYADAYVPPAIDEPVTEQPMEPMSEPPTEPATEPATAAATEAAPSDATPSEELADQNIFEMLGVTTGTPEQREQFLDELQQVIWEDFLENDTKLLLTESEQAELQTIMQAAPDKSLEQQEQVVVYLEKLIPDLEDIMLEKALQLKEEMARERLKALRELHRNDTDHLATIDHAEQLMNEQKWRSASEALNSVG